MCLLISDNEYYYPTSYLPLILNSFSTYPKYPLMNFSLSFQIQDLYMIFHRLSLFYYVTFSSGRLWHLQSSMFKVHRRSANCQFAISNYISYPISIISIEIVLLLLWKITPLIILLILVSVSQLLSCRSDDWNINVLLVDRLITSSLLLKNLLFYTVLDFMIVIAVICMHQSKSILCFLLNLLGVYPPHCLQFCLIPS